MTLRPLLAAAAAACLSLLATGCTTLPADSAATETPSPVAPTPEPAPEPQPALVAEPPPAPEPELAPLLPRMRLDPLQDAERALLWERLRDGFALPDLDTDLVRKWEQWYARDPAYVQRMTERGGRYLWHIVEEVQRRGLPTELALLPFIESAFNPQALSRAAASGMWQFMPATGRDFELQQNLFRDDRRDVLASTRAALDYLQRLHGLFGDWQLALAAYNWGQGNVSRAIERNRRAGQPTDYLSLAPRMPQETREYVPKLQAVKNIVLKPETFSLTLPAITDEPYFLSVPIERDIDVGLVARLSGLTLDEFHQLNPQLNKPVILAAGTPQVLLPYDAANRFIAGMNAHKGPLASWTAWVAPRTLKLAEAGKLVGVSEDELRALNNIPPRMLVKAGSTLLVPRAPHADDDVAEHIADNASLALAPELQPLRRVRFKAGRQGDSVAAVAKRYGVSAAQVARWNGVRSGARFKSGQAIVVMLPAEGTRAASAATRQRPAAASSARQAAPRAAVKSTSARPAAKSAPARRKAASGTKAKGGR